VAPGGRDKWPGLDALLKGVARREFGIVAGWRSALSPDAPKLIEINLASARFGLVGVVSRHRGDR
jgi:hypothetical protein